MRRLEGVIFDLDGTLADTLPVAYAAFRRAFQLHVGLTFTNDEIHARFGPTEEGVIRALAPAAAEACYRDYLRFYAEEHRRCPAPFPGIVEALDRLEEAGARAAVVTGKGAESAAISLERIGLAERFEIVEAGTAERAVKAECMRRVLDTWRVEPARVAAIGDSPSDIRAARENGIVPLAAAWASTAAPDELAAGEPDELFHQPDQFLRWLDEQIQPDAAA